MTNYKQKTVTVNASILKRISAFVLDFLIVMIILSIPLNLYFADKVPQGSFNEVFELVKNNPEFIRISHIINIVMFGVLLLYFTLSEYYNQKTIAMSLFKLEIKYIGKKSKKSKLLQCLIRNIFIIPYFPFVLLWIVDPIYVMFNKDNQRWTEKISRTKVVEKKSYL